MVVVVRGTTTVTVVVVIVVVDFHLAKRWNSKVVFLVVTVPMVIYHLL